jgi:hypothetical protein
VSEVLHLRKYIPGDVVKMEIEIVHWMNVNAVKAVYIHTEDEQIQIILSTDYVTKQQRLSNGEKHSFWNPVGEVTAEHNPGGYSLDSIELLTAAGNTISVRASDHFTGYDPRGLRLEVIEEPASMPTFGAVTLVP